MKKREWKALCCGVVLAVAGCGNGPVDSADEPEGSSAQSKLEKANKEIQRLRERVSFLLSQNPQQPNPTPPTSSTSSTPTNTLKNPVDFSCSSINLTDMGQRRKCKLQCQINAGFPESCERRLIRAPCSGLGAPTCEATAGCVVDARSGTNAQGHPYKPVCVHVTPVPHAAGVGHCRLKENAINMATYCTTLAANRHTAAAAAAAPGLAPIPGFTEGECQDPVGGISLCAFKPKVLVATCVPDPALIATGRAKIVAGAVAPPPCTTATPSARRLLKR